MAHAQENALTAPRPFILSPQIGLAVIVLVALALRLGIGATISADQAMVDDSGWYFIAGELLVTDQMRPENVVPFPPLYPLMVGVAKMLFGLDGAIIALRLAQSILSAALAAFVYRIAHRLSGSRRAGVAAALGIALNPLFIIDANQIVTETLFISLTTWAISVYVGPDERLGRKMAAAGALLGLGTLTRAVFVAFPLGLALHVLLTHGLRREWRRGLRLAGVLLVVYVAVVGVWTVYSVVRLNRFQFGGYGANDLLLTATLGRDGTQNMDQVYRDLTGGTVPSDGERDALVLRTLGDTLRADPLGYAAQRLGQLGEALVQPHHTPFFVGPSLKEAALAWLRKDRSLDGLSRLVGDPTFVPKALMYVVHWSALVLAAAGLWRTRREWLIYAPVSGLIVYFALIHLFLLAIPRYLFPITPALWVFAGVALDGLTRRFSRSRTGDLRRRPGPAR
ncbi:MAG: glycosyltransferase family 39 protein [Anaerolineae bacterium]|nr:glycosyltransferase family 39 protein [Anaerolineae bacterium]